MTLIDLSANEFEQLVVKAVRGAGHDAGTAEEIAAALRVDPTRVEGLIKDLEIGADLSIDDAVPARPQRVSLPQETFNSLARLARKTYVKNSEQSRIAGAGAGLTDND